MNPCSYCCSFQIAQAFSRLLVLPIRIPRTSLTLPDYLKCPGRTIRHTFHVPISKPCLERPVRDIAARARRWQAFLIRSDQDECVNVVDVATTLTTQPGYYLFLLYLENLTYLLHSDLCPSSGSYCATYRSSPKTPTRSTKGRVNSGRDFFD